MKKFTVYFKLFGKLYKFNVENPSVNTQKEAEDYVIKTLIPDSIEFFEPDKIKNTQSEVNKEIDKTFEQLSDKIDKTFQNVEKTIDKAFDKFGSIFDGLKDKTK